MRLQPEDRAEAAAQRIDDSRVSGWLDNDPDLADELSDQRERRERLQADEDLLLALQLHGLSGPPWNRFSRELVRCGLGVLRTWIYRGTIYGKAKALTGYGLGRIEGWPDPEKVEELAADTVVAALAYFRDKVLKTHRWQSSGGASLGTFFIRPVPLPVRQHLPQRAAGRARTNRAGRHVDGRAARRPLRPHKRIEETIVAP